MKSLKSLLSLLVLLFAGGVAQAGQAVTCEECRTAAQDFVTHLLSEEGITEQTGGMKSQVCPQLGLEGCEDILDMWYPDMAQCIFDHFIIESDICSRGGLCSLRGSLTDWTCEECMSISAALADYMRQDETIVAGVSHLQGECFCGQPGHTEDCPGLVEAVLPLAFPVLGDFITESTVEHCQEIVGVC